MNFYFSIAVTDVFFLWLDELVATQLILLKWKKKIDMFSTPELSSYIFVENWGYSISENNIVVSGDGRLGKLCFWDGSKYETP